MKRDFRLLWTGSTLSALGDYVVPAALALAIVRATGSAAALATVLACATVPRLALLPIGGVLADRWHPRRVAVVTDLIRAGAQLTVAIELIGGRFRLPDLAVAAAVGGAASAFALPTASPLVAATVPAADRGRANGLLGVGRSTCQILGPALAGTLILAVGAGWAFAVDAATFLVSAACLALLRLSPAAERPARASMLRDLVDGWSEVRRHRWFWTSLIGHATWNFSAAVWTTLGPLIAVRDLGGDGVWIALLQTGAVGVLAGSLVATRLGDSARLRRPILVANLGLASYAAPLALLGAGAPAPVLIAAYGVAMAGLGFLNPVWETTVQRHIAADRLARVTAYDILVSLAAMPLGYAVAAPAAAAVGQNTLLYAVAGLVFVATAGMILVPAVRRFGTPAGPQEPAEPRVAIPA